MLFKREKENKKNPFRSIISINAYTNEYYLFSGNKFKKIDKLFYDKSNFTVSTLDTKDFISATIELSVNIPEEDMHDAIELKAYDEFDLDQTAEYIIRYIEIPELKTDKNRYFQIFVAEPKIIEEIFEPIQQTIKYIDYIYPKPLLLHNLYRRNIVEPYGVHGYLYFQKEDAFIALFKDGRYLYSKSMKFSFEHIYERFCEIYGERVDEEAFYNLLLTEGLKTSNYDYQDCLMKVFNEIFLHINDILIYSKRAFEIESIDLFYIGSEVGPLSGINEYAITYLGIESYDFDFDYEIDTSSKEYIDQFHYLSIFEALYNMEGNQSPNFTLFFRPPPFLARRSGQFIVTTLVATIIALSFPIYYFTYDAYIKISNKRLYKEEQELSKTVLAIQRKIASLESEKKKVVSLIRNEKTKFEKKKMILSAIYDKKVNYPMKAKIIVGFANDMSKFDVHTTKIVNDENRFVLSLVAKNENRITKLIKHLTNSYRNIHTNIAKISKDKKTGMYYGDLEVTIL